MDINIGDHVLIKAKIVRLPHSKDKRYVYIVDEELSYDCRYGECSKDAISYVIGIDTSNNKT